MQITARSVWYLSHPVASDERFTYEQNLAHALHMAKLCYEEGFRVYVPWHTLCLIMPDSDPEYRRIGLEVDCDLAKMTGLMIMTGHKVSSGMQKELEAVKTVGHTVINLVGTSDDRCRKFLRYWKEDHLDLGGEASATRLS